MDMQTLQQHLKDAEIIKCDKCKNEEFSQVYQVKKLSALLSPSGQETFVPVQVFKCASCDHINKDFI